ncbi:glycosyltransferase [Paenibacillus sp. 2TAB23]|uniref:glycosyltransferase family 2 protein n=1 Tax=Paenibacillus sp. 2TAB23 TaxID=3233004 RepID=UPI003F9C282E
MELMIALLQSGLIEEEQAKDIRITTINNNHYRTSKAATSRFLVHLQGQPLCSIKKLPNTDFFNIEAAKKLQKKLEGNKVVRAPKIFTIYQGNLDYYLVEQYIQGHTLTQEIKENGFLDSSFQLIQLIVQELMIISGNNMDSTFNDEIEKIRNRVEKITDNSEIIQCFLDELEKYGERLKFKSILSSGDIAANNIIITNEGPYLVDFDLSRHTQLFWIDIIRFFYYLEDSISNKEFPVNKIQEMLPRNIDIRFLILVFLISEMNLQAKIHDIGHNEIVQSNIEQIFMERCYEYFGITPTEVLEIEKNVSKEDSIFVQIYWNEQYDQSFSEDRSFKQEAFINDQHTFSFLLNKYITSLRIDPINSPGHLEIKSIMIKEANGSWISLLDETPYVVDQYTSLVELDEGIFITTTRSDPQLVFNQLPIHNLSEIKLDIEVVQQLDSVNKHLDNLKEKVEILQLKAIKGEFELKEKSNYLNHVEQLLSKTNLVLYETTAEILKYQNSRSWKLTKPIRYSGSIVKKIFRITKKMARRAVGQKAISLMPLHDVIQHNVGEWESTGSDPQFLIEPTITGGWFEISYEGSASSHTALALYYDIGSGMSEQHVIPFGFLDTGLLQKKKYIFLPNNIQTLRLDPGDKKQHFVLKNVTIRSITKIERFYSTLNSFFQKHGYSFSTLKYMSKKISIVLRNEGVNGLIKKNKSLFQGSIQSDLIQNDYNSYLRLEEPSESKLESMKQESLTFKYRPLVSILVPVYNVEEEWLRLCIESAQKQVYTNWELCLVDDCSTKPHIREVLEEYSKTDDRIKFKIRSENGHISATSNDALDLATGEFIALLDHDDELATIALYENIKLLNHFRDADVIYSDEDKITVDGERHSPYFKPDWSPDTLLSQMYTCHLTVYRKSIVIEAGKFRIGYEGSQDYDLMLRVSELTNKIHHIPQILYHWRTIPNSTANNANVKNYAHEAGLKALEDALLRRKIDGWVETFEDSSNLYRVHYISKEQPKVSIIIPSKDLSEVLNKCLESIFNKSQYTNFEVIIVDNGSKEESTHQLYRHWTECEPNRFFVYELDIPFNYSKLNNYGVTKATGGILLLLNNDVEVLTSDWLDEMVGHATRSEIGAIGASLLYPDDSLQHAGVVLGLGGVAGHSHKHFPLHHPGYFKRLEMISNYTAVTAACLMVRKDIYNEVGGFEEELQVAFNDVDFCLKIWDKGYRNIWLPQVRLYHYESKSRGHEDTPAKQKRFHGEIQWMRDRWSYILDNDPCYNPNLTKDREDFSLGKSYQN